MFGYMPKNNKFGYTPRYYDERKERLDAIKKKHENPDRALIEERIRGKIRRYRGRKNPFMSIGVRFLIILAVLFALTFMLLRFFGIPVW